MTGAFSVEPIAKPARGQGDWQIRFTPAAKIMPDGSRVLRLSFPVLIATDLLSEQESTLATICNILNSSSLFE